MWLHQTSYRHSQVKYAKDEVQAFQMKYNRRKETQRITLNNMAAATEVCIALHTITRCSCTELCFR